MATVTIYTIDKNNEVIDQFDMDYNEGIASYWGKKSQKGNYYCARKGISIPYKLKKKLFAKKVKPSSDQVQE
jgi:hypothetical protein